MPRSFVVAQFIARSLLAASYAKSVGFGEAKLPFLSSLILVFRFQFLHKGV